MIKHIDTRHGTANQYSFSKGNCLPYTGVPFGMNYFGVQTTDAKGSWWFHPDDRTFQGYRLTHQPSPWMGDFSHLLMSPVSGKFSELSLFHTQSSYRPKEATFRPYEMNIFQLRYQLESTLVPSLYGGILEMNYSQQDNGLLLTLPGLKEVKQVNDSELQVKIVNFSGSEDPNFAFYLSLAFEKPILEMIQKDEEEKSFLHLQFGDVTQQTVRFGTSFISFDQATFNRLQEKDWSLADYERNSISQWEEYFNRVDVEHTNFEDTKTFYHNLYRIFLFPQTFYEVNAAGEKIHYDTKNREVKKGVLYTNNGFWDTYKTVYPLYSLIAKERYEEMLEGFLNSFDETGFLPKWLSPDERGLMPGTLIDAVIADAAKKGIRSDLMPRFLEAMKKAATVQSENPNYGRQGTTDYLKYGYVPSNYHESVNHTLDYAYSDYCISQVAASLDKTEDVKHYQKQAFNYQNIFDAETGFMRAKDSEGNFRENFLDVRWGRDYAEGSAWQSSFAVYQDFAGLIEKMGGNKVFTDKLVQLCNQAPSFNVEGYGFEIHEMSEMAAVEFGQLAISNQPSFHYPFLFSYVGKPEMAQPLIRNLMTQCFSYKEDGYPGDEDNGSMAAWYVFNSLGFYPVTPGSGEYVIGLPFVKKAVLTLSNGKKLTITATPNNPQQMFVEDLHFNNEEITRTFLTHEELMEGGKLDFHLGIVPHPRNYGKDELPFSLSK